MYKQADFEFEEELRERLEELFPKGECSERGQALVLYAYAIINFRKYCERAEAEIIKSREARTEES